MAGGTRCAAARRAPATSAATTVILRVKAEAPESDPAASALRRKTANADTTTPVAAQVTGSPHSACSAKAIASAAPAPIGLDESSAPSAPSRTHGINATDQERFGVLSIETTGPDSAKAHAPSAAAASGSAAAEPGNV